MSPSTTNRVVGGQSRWPGRQSDGPPQRFIDEGPLTTGDIQALRQIARGVQIVWIQVVGSIQGLEDDGPAGGIGEEAEDVADLYIAIAARVPDRDVKPRERLWRQADLLVSN